MLIREEAEKLLLVTQPVHSWVSGQLARSWGNQGFGQFDLREEVCLAAELHDIGFLEWECTPSFNPARGRPHDFRDLPFDAHLDLWAHSVKQTRPFGSYSTLLVSLHMTGLAQNHMNPDNPDQAAKLRRFLAEQAGVQAELLAGLREQTYFERHITPAALERNRSLLAVWDEISLLCVLGQPGVIRVEGVPASPAQTPLTLHFQRQPFCATVAPWPFSCSHIRVPCEIRRIAARTSSAAAMHEALAGALPETVFLCLSPAHE